MSKKKKWFNKQLNYFNTIDGGAAKQTAHKIAIFQQIHKKNYNNNNQKIL